ncbi:MAG TPA: transcriptional regulator, partial [Pyrinomonadaceae bacterium]|nr:transcriptional regulator [Pyrinomonadaceae bacterium]
MFKSETQLYKFGAFHLDTLKRVLFHDNTRIQLPSRAFDVLLALVEHNHSVIDKEELIQLVWGERAVEENNLTRHISTLRKVFDESPSDHRYIVTVPGRGYSFVADVERLPGDGRENGSGKQNGKVPGLGPGDGNGFEPVTVLYNPRSFETTAITAEPPGPTATARNYWLWATALVIALT